MSNLASCYNIPTLHSILREVVFRKVIGHCCPGVNNTSEVSCCAVAKKCILHSSVIINFINGTKTEARQNSSKLKSI